MVRADQSAPAVSVTDQGLLFACYRPVAIDGLLDVLTGSPCARAWGAKTRSRLLIHMSMPSPTSLPQSPVESA